MVFMPRRGRNIYKRKDNRWEARVYFNSGKKYKSVYGKTYKEAAEKQDKLRLEMGSSNNADHLFNTIAENWYIDKSFTVKEGTLFSYSTKLKKHILPYFSEILVSKLTEQMLAGFIATKRAEGLSDKYISDMVIIIKSISAWAHKRYGITNKIADFKNIKLTVKEPKMLDTTEQKKLQQHLLQQADSVSLGVFLNMFTGLRIGEMCALKWSDIDLESGIISVNKSVQRLPNSKTGKTEVKISRPKTATSVRMIPMPQFVCDRLKSLKQADNCYILSSTEKLIEPRSFTNKFKRILSDAGVSPVKYHSLRHVFATNCMQNHFDIKTLSEILGHSSPNITLKMYLHSTMEQKRNCMNRLSLL